jgi:hypothetical protein
MRMADKLKRKINLSLRFSGKAGDVATSETGKMMRSASVTMSAVPMVRSCA